VTADAAFDATRRRSPLAGFPLPTGLREVPFLAQIDLRVDPTDTAVAARLGAVLGAEPPTVANTVVGDLAGIHVLWLGPDEWLVVGPPTTEGELERRLRAALGDATGSVVDVSANRTVLELSGPRARAVLEGGCSLDLHPRTFGPGDCAQTLLARANVIVQQLTDEPLYRIFVRPSFALYVATWLTDAVASDRA
jgi:sarcosine oxidase subunit gamma